MTAAPGCLREAGAVRLPARCPASPRGGRLSPAQGPRYLERSAGRCCGLCAAFPLPAPARCGQRLPAPLPAASLRPAASARARPPPQTPGYRPARPQLGHPGPGGPGGWPERCPAPAVSWLTAPALCPEGGQSPSLSCSRPAPGAPSLPQLTLEKQRDTESQCWVICAGSTAWATAAFSSRAPSMCTRSPKRSASCWTWAGAEQPPVSPGATSAPRSRCPQPLHEPLRAARRRLPPAGGGQGAARGPRPSCACSPGR